MKLACCLLVLLVGSILAQDDVIDKLGELGSTELLRYIERAGLTDVLRGDGPFTIFAPSNAAIEALPDIIRRALEGSPQLLAQVLTFHVTGDRVLTGSLANEQLIPTLEGNNNRINIYAAKGIVTATGSPISATDIEASNGIVHVLDRMIIPLPRSTAFEEVAFDPDLTTLASLVVLAGLDDVLSGNGPFTVFAPTDEAFSKVPDSILEDLIQNPDKLTAVLLYHVVPSTQFSAGLVSGEVGTVEGSNIRITVNENGSVDINDANVIFADVATTNGVIHFLDSVLLPEL